MAGPLIAGVVFLKIDGQQFQLRGSLNIQPNSLTREGIAGQDGVHGFKETPTVPYMEMELSDNGGLSLVDLQAITNATITAELKSGKTYIGRNAWAAGEFILDTTDGKIKGKFEALSIEEDV